MEVGQVSLLARCMPTRERDSYNMRLLAKSPSMFILLTGIYKSSSRREDEAEARPMRVAYYTYVQKLERVLLYYTRV